MDIYRVENEARTGPYYDDSYETIDGWIWNKDRHPLPHEDGLADFTHEHKFGFASMESLLSWFEPKLLRALHDADKGFYVATYRVRKDAVMVGGTQVAFRYHAWMKPVQKRALIDIVVGKV